MNAEQELKLENVLKANFHKTAMREMIRGIKTACAVISEKAQNDKLSDNEKLKDILAFCKTSLAMEVKEPEQNG